MTPMVKAFGDLLQFLRPAAPAIIPITVALGGFVAVVKVANVLSGAWVQTFGRLIPKIAGTTAATALETEAVVANTAAVEANTIARGLNAKAPAVGASSTAATAASTAGTIGTGTAGMGAGTAASGLLGGAAASAAAVAIPVLVIGASAVLLTRDLNNEPGMDRRRDIDPETGRSKVGSRRYGRGGTNDPGFKDLAESNLELRGSLVGSIMSSHTAADASLKATGAQNANTSAVGTLTDAMAANTDAQKSLAQTMLDEAREAASKGAGVLSNKDFLKYVGTLPSGTAVNDRTGQVGMKYTKFARGGRGVTSGPMLALIGEEGPEEYDIRPVGKGGGKAGRSVSFTNCTFSAQSPRQLMEDLGNHLALAEGGL